MCDSHSCIFYLIPTIFALKTLLKHENIPFLTLNFSKRNGVDSKLSNVQGFSLASALGHSPKIVPDVREFAVQFGQFVRDYLRERTLYSNAQ